MNHNKQNLRQKPVYHQNQKFYVVPSPIAVNIASLILDTMYTGAPTVRAISMPLTMGSISTPYSSSSSSFLRSLLFSPFLLLFMYDLWDFTIDVQFAVS